MKSSTALIAVLLLLGIAPGRVRGDNLMHAPPHAWQEMRIQLHFAHAEVAEVLQALSSKTHAQIVFPGELSKRISIQLTAYSIGDALRYITAAAGLAFRKVGNAYIVAAPADLRQALEPVGEQAEVPLTGLEPEEAVKLLSSALPYLTVRPAGDALDLIGAREDLDRARALLEQQQSRLATDPLTKETVALQDATPSQVVAVLKNLYPALGVEPVGAADKPGGVVVLSGPRSQVTAAKTIVNQIDVPAAPQGPSRTYRIYNIKYSSAPILLEFLKQSDPNIFAATGPETYSPLPPNFHPLSGATLGSSTGAGTAGGLGGGGGSGGVGVSGEAGAGTSLGTPTYKEGDRAKTLVLGGTKADLDEAFRLLAQIDVAPQQVMIDVKVVDMERDKSEALGFQYNWTPFSFLDAPPGTTVTQGALGPNSFTPSTLATRPLGFGAISRVPWNITAILNAMVTRSEAKILADPRIQVLDNDDANIFIGDTIRTAISSASLAGTTVQIAEFPVGVILLVRPRINGDGRITMRVHPVVSTVTQITSGIPQTSSREAETTVMVADGETIVIGGLIQDEMSKQVQEIPLLSKLPIVGELFRNRTTSHTHTEVVVFITPHIIKN